MAVPHVSNSRHDWSFATPIAVTQQIFKNPSPFCTTAKLINITYYGNPLASTHFQASAGSILDRNDALPIRSENEETFFHSTYAKKF